MAKPIYQVENEIAKPIYQEEFESFMKECNAGQVDGETVGKTIVRLAQEFATYNMILSSKEIKLNIIAAEKVQETDEISGKSISVSKAELLIKATEEYADVKRTKTDLENIESFINALKYLQKGILNEYSHLSGS